MQKVKKILLVFIIWRIFLFGIQFFSLRIPFRYSFPYVEAVLEKYQPPFLRSWANFDGVHYLNIAKSSYSAQYTQAFFPFYPLLIRWLGNLFFAKNYLVAGQFISGVFFILSLWLLFKLASIDLGEKIAWRVIIFLVFFPTSFYFISVYAESLFLFLVLACFYFARKGNWWLSGFFGGLASGTKVFGIFLLPALIIEHSLQEGDKKKKIKDKILNIGISFKKHLSCYLPISLTAGGLFLYMIYLENAFNNPIYFATAQPAFGASRSVTKIILIYQVFWRYFKMIVTVKKNDPLYFTVWLEFLSVVIFLFLIYKAYRDKVRLSYLIFALLSLIAPTLTGTFSSMPRYVLVLFPGFMALALTKNQKLVKGIFALEAVLTVFCVLFFLRGYWVA